MKRTPEPYNLNTRTHWNGVYGDNLKIAEYKAAGTTRISYDGGKTFALDKTHRFTRALEEVKDGDKIIDIGSGVGNFTKLVKKTYPGCEVWGTDISDVIIQTNIIDNPDITYLEQQIGNQKDVPNDYFDVVFCGETIEHLDQPELLFQDAYRVLKIGGKLIITTPNKDHIKSDEHVWFFEKEDVKKLYEDNGFEKVEFVELPDTEHLFVIFGIGVKQ